MINLGKLFNIYQVTNGDGSILPHWLLADNVSSIEEAERRIISFLEIEETEYIVVPMYFAKSDSLPI